MTKFQVGDIVNRTFPHRPEGVEDYQIITSISECGEYIRFANNRYGWRTTYFTLAARVNPKPFNREDYL